MDGAPGERARLSALEMVSQAQVLYRPLGFGAVWMQLKGTARTEWRGAQRFARPAVAHRRVCGDGRVLSGLDTHW